MNPRSAIFIALLGCVPLALPATALASPGEKTWETANLEVRTALDRGDTASALRAAEKAADTARQAFGPDHMKTAVALKKLADVQRLAGRSKQAASTLENAGRNWSGSLGSSHPYVSDIGVQAARDFAAAGDADAAVRTMLRVIDGQRKYFGPGHTAVASALQELSRIERSLGREADALVHEREAGEILYAALDAAHPRSLEACVGIAGRLSAGGDLIGARAELKRVLARASSVPNPPLRKLAEAWVLSGDLAFADRDVVAAEAAYAAAQTLLERAGDTALPSERLTLLYKQLELQRSLGREDEAARTAEAARLIERDLQSAPSAEPAA
jgi:hypothetical protein